MAKKGSQLTVRTATEIQGGEFVILGYAGKSYQMTLDELKKFIGIIEEGGGSVDLTQVSTDILPLADASKDIGSLEKRWKKIYSTALTVKAQSVDEEEVNIHDGGIEGKIGQDIQWSIDGSGKANFYELTVNGADVATMQYVNNELSKYVTTDTLTKNYVSNSSLTEILKKYYESGYVDFLLSSKASTGDLNKTNTQLGIVQTDVATLKSYFQDTDDVDDIINKWRELEAFLAGQTETSTLADLLTLKADKSTVVAINSRVTDLEDSDFVDIDSLRSTLEGYYTKEEVDALLGEAGGVDLTGYVNEIAASGTGNGIASVSKDGSKLTFNKATFLTDASVPAARTTFYGGIKIGYKDNGKNYGVLLDDSGKAYVNVPWESYDLSKFLDKDGGSVNYLQVSPANTSDGETINIGVTANEISGIHGNDVVDWKINSSGAWIGANQLATQSWVEAKDYLSKYGDAANSLKLGGVNASDYALKADYLPLSGGTLNGLLNIDGSATDIYIRVRQSKTSKACFGWESGVGAYLYNYSGYRYLGISDEGTPFYKTSLGINTLIHSGNISDYAVTSTTLNDFPRLTGTSPSGASATGTWGIDISGSAAHVMVNYLYNRDEYMPILMTGRDSIGTAINNYVATDFLGQLTYNPKQNILKAGTFEGNATSATKLKTARTIWGQSFDGSGDVSGDLSIGAHRILGRLGASVLDSRSEWVILGNDTATNGWPTYIDGNTVYLRYGTSHTTGLILNSSGNVGIGTTDPYNTLDVHGSIGMLGEVMSLKGDLTGTNTNANSPKLWLGAMNYSKGFYTGSYIQALGDYSYGKHTLSFFTKDSDDYTTAPVERMRITPSGNVCIGTTNSAYKLRVAGNGAFNNEICVYDADDIYRLTCYEYQGIGRIYSYNETDDVFGDLWIGNNNGGIITVKASGNVGIGTNNPNTKLHVVGGAKITGGLTVGSSTDYIAYDGSSLTGYKSSSSAWSIDPSGNGSFASLTVGGNAVLTQGALTSINASLNKKANTADVIPWSATHNYASTINPNVLTSPVSDRWYLVVKAAGNGNKLMVNVPWVNTTYDSLKNPYSLTFGSKTYDGSSAKTITASDLGAVTSSSLESTLTDYVKTNVLNDYLSLAGGTMTGTIITPGDDSVVIKPAKNNYDQIGGEGIAFWKIFATNFYGALHGNADTSAKLQNPRTIWGQSFDGSGDVSGFVIMNSGADGIYIYNEGIAYHDSDNAWAATNVKCTSNGSVYLSPSGGNVGVGTTNPQAKLHVHGIIYGNQYNASDNKAGAALILNKGNNYAGMGASGQDGRNFSVGTVNLDGTWINEILTIAENGRVGIGTANPNTKLHVVGDAKIEGALSSYGITATTTAATDAAFTHYAGSTKLWWVSSYNNCANFNTALYVQSGSTPFKVATENDLTSYLPKAGGEMAAGSRISCVKNMYIGRADNVGWVGLQDICSQASLDDGLWSIRTNGTAHFKNIYEGGTLLSSKYLLQSGGTISGSLTFSATSGSHIIGNSNSEIIFQPSNDTSGANIPLKIAKTGSSTYTMYCDESEVYDLGTSSYKWNILYCRSASQSSDATLKNILGNVELTTSQIANAPAVNFTWKNGGAKDVGTIAQYWKNVLPEVVSGEEGGYGMNYAVLGVVSSIILARNIETHEQRIARLEKEISDLQKELNALVNNE